MDTQHHETPATHHIVEVHRVNGKHTAVGDIVHYTDQAGARHPARIEAVSGTVTNLHVLHAHGDSKNTHLASVSHSITPAPHTWTHLPE